MIVPSFFSNYFIFILGFILVILSILEFIFPNSMYTFWQKIITSFLARIYGFIVMISGIILTTFNGSFSTVIFILGIILAILGPLSILYPEILRKMLSDNEASLDLKNKIKLIRTEGTMHLLLGCLFIYVTYRFIII